MTLTILLAAISPDHLFLDGWARIISRPSAAFKMDSTKQFILLQPQPNDNKLPPLFSNHTISAPALVALQMAKVCTVLEDALGSIPTLGEKPIVSMKLLTLPYRLPFGMFNAMTNLTKRLYNPLYLMANYNGSWERIGSITGRLSGLVEGLMVSFMRIRGTPKNEPCTLDHLNQLANQLQQLAENVANLQETNEEFRSKYLQENLLAEVGDMKGYLELLYQQLRHEEMRKLHVEEENAILRQSIEKPSLSSPVWDSSTRRESNDDVERFSNNCSLGTSSSSVIHSQAASFNAPIGIKGRNPPARIETSLSEFQVKLGYLYQEASYSVSWLRPPKEGDVIVFTFHEPVLLKRFKIGTGHYEYPTNKLSEATVEILPTSSQVKPENEQSLDQPDKFLVIGHFDHSGLAEGVVDWRSLGTIQSLRVRIHDNCHHWIIMTEMLLETALPEEESTLSSEEYFECW